MELLAGVATKPTVVPAQSKTSNNKQDIIMTRTFLLTAAALIAIGITGAGAERINEGKARAEQSEKSTRASLKDEKRFLGGPDTKSLGGPDTRRRKSKSKPGKRGGIEQED